MKNVLKLAVATAIVLAPLFLVSVPSHSEGDAPPAYVGAEKCKMCHLTQYKTWSAGRMDTDAWAAIKDVPDKEKCYKCHTTGYGQPGGFVDAEKTPNLTGVQCEACHGAGGAHLALGIANKDPEQRRATINKNIQDCRGCHTPHTLDKGAAARAAAAAAAGH